MNLCLRLGEQDILRGITMEVALGEVVALCGPNGAGKSTLLSCLAGEHPSCADQVSYGSELVSGLSAQALSRRRVVLEQSPSLAAEFTVLELVELGAPFDVAPDMVRALGDEILEWLGIAELADRLVSTLSGGQQHRAHLARVLVQLRANEALNHACALFLDEPTAALDIRHQITVLTRVTELARQGAGALLVLHDLNLAAGFADRVILMKEGCMTHAGPPDRVLTAPILTEVYETPIAVSTVPGGHNVIHPVLPARAPHIRCA